MFFIADVAFMISNVKKAHFAVHLRKSASTIPWDAAMHATTSLRADCLQDAALPVKKPRTVSRSLAFALIPTFLPHGFRTVHLIHAIQIRVLLGNLVTMTCLGDRGVYRRKHARRTRWLSAELPRVQSCANLLQHAHVLVLQIHQLTPPLS